MSASSKPTDAPLLRRAAARLTATVDLPTPPLPDATAIVCLTPGRTSDGLGRMKAGRTLAVIRTSTAVTPGSSPTASSACDLNRSRTGQAGVVSSNVKLTFPCGLTSRSLIIPRLTTSRPRSGSLIRPSTSSTCCDEGAAIGAKETALRVRAPYSRFGVYETALLGMLSSCTGWATAAREVVDAAAGKRVISFGARHVHPLIGPTMEYSAVVGGCAGCATPLGAQLAGLQGASGTMPHAMILLFGDTVKAAVAFDEQMGDDVLRIVLVDTFKDEAEEALRVAEALGKRLRGVRLDTPGERGGVTVDLVQEGRARRDQAGVSPVGVFILGGRGAARIREFEAAKCPIHSYGVGMAISSAPPIAFTADIKEISGKPMTKRGRIPGIANNPGLVRVI